MGRGDHAKAPGWRVALAPAGEGGEQEQAKVTALGLLTLSSLVQTFVPGRFARPGGETDVGFHKTHPSDCGFLLIPVKCLCWDRPTARSRPTPVEGRKGEFY